MTVGYFGLPTSFREYSSAPSLAKPCFSSAIFALAKELPDAQVRWEKIENDPRLKEYVFPYGDTKVVRLQTQSLVAWWTWRANSTDPITADQELENFIENIEENQSRIKTLWVYGPKSDETVSLTEEVKLTPLADMPISHEKLNFSELRPLDFGYRLKPTAALTCDCMDNIADRMRCRHEIREATEKLGDIAAIINCLNGCICVPAFSTSYAPEHVPPGHFGGGGGQFWTEQAVPRSTCELSGGG